MGLSLQGDKQELAGGFGVAALRLIRYRGQITIIDHEGLEKTACECYALDRQRVNRLL